MAGTKPGSYLTRFGQVVDAITLAGNREQVQEEIAELTKFAAQAKAVEDSGAEAKLSRFKDLLHKEGFFDHSDKWLLIFTEFKDTLDYLVGVLKNWGFRVGFIHGGMKTGSRDEPNSRLYSEQQFKDGAIQVLVATEAAGEGINLQCCHILFNYDIPWNPNDASPKTAATATGFTSLRAASRNLVCKTRSKTPPASHGMKSKKSITTIYPLMP